MKKSSVKLDIVVLILGRALQLSYSFAAVKLLTNMLAKAEVGFYYLLMSVIGFVSMTFMSPAGVLHSKILNEFYEKKLLFTSFVILFIYGLLVAVAVSVPLVMYLTYNIEQSASTSLLLLIVFVDLTAGMVGSTVVASFNMLFNRKKFVVYTNLTLFLGLALAFLLVEFVERDAVYWILGVMLGKFIMFFMVVMDFSRNVDVSLDMSFVKRNMLSKVAIKKASFFCIPVAFAALATWVQNHYYRFYVDSVFSLEMLALVGLGMSLAVTVSMAVESVVSQYFIPNIYKSYQANGRESFAYLNKLFGAILVFYISLFLFIMHFSDLVVKVASNEDFSGAAKFFFWGLFIEFFRVSTRLFSHVLYLESNTRDVMNSSFFGAAWLFSLLSLFWFFELVSMDLLILAMASSSCCSLFFVYRRYKTVSGLSIGFRGFVLPVIFSLVSVLFLKMNVGLITVIDQFVSVFLSLVLFFFIQFFLNRNIFRFVFQSNG